MQKTKNTIKLLVTLFAFLFLFPAKTSAATITVNSGESIQTKCVAAAASGDTCQVLSGNYIGRVLVSKPLQIICSGSCVVKDGFMVSANNVTIRGFEITGTYGIVVKGQYDTIDGNYIHDLTTNEGGIQLYDSNVSHAVITNNRIARVYNQSISMAGSYNLMEGNDASYTKQPATATGDADCFDVFGSNNTYRNNYCHDVTFGNNITTAHIDCFQTWNWLSKGGALKDSIIEGNVCDVPSVGSAATAKAFQLEGKDGSGYIDTTTEFPCRNVTFKNNIVHSNLFTIFNYCQNMTVTNNTFVGDGDIYTGGMHLLKLKSSNTIRYNIFVDADEVSYSIYDTLFSPSVLGGYNFIYRSNGAPLGSAKTGDVWDVDPQFVDRANKNYHLKSGSPACGFGAYPCESTNTVTPEPTTTVKQGDANNDGLVNEADYAVWYQSYLNNPTGSGVANGDFNNNSVVDGVDYTIWMLNSQ